MSRYIQAKEIEEIIEDWNMGDLPDREDVVILRDKVRNDATA